MAMKMKNERIRWRERKEENEDGGNENEEEENKKEWGMKMIKTELIKLGGSTTIAIYYLPTRVNAKLPFKI